jgi:pimeloyl-ACP methyl ester carboxylesterase
VRRAGKLAAVALLTLLVVLAVNAWVTPKETSPAGVTAPGGEILELSSVDLQVVDESASDPDARGAPIVLLHCYACSLRWWDGIAPELAREHRVIRIDLIGHGGSAKPSSEYTIGDQAAAVAEALNRLEVEGATLVGHSLGGIVAVAVAESSSELVDRVAVLGTGPSEGTATLPIESRLSRAPLIGPATWRLRTDGLIRRGYSSAFAPGFDWEEAFEDPDQAVVDNRAMTYRSYQRTPGAGDDFLAEGPLPPRLTTSGLPFLAILGAEDQIVDTDVAADEYGTVPGGRVIVLDGIGHSPQFEAPGRTLELLGEFAGRLPQPEAARPGGGRGRGGAGGQGRGGRRG